MIKSTVEYTAAQDGEYTAAQDGEVRPSNKRVRVIRSVGLVVVVFLPWWLANDLASLVGDQTGPPARPPRSRGG